MNHMKVSHPGFQLLAVALLFACGAAQAQTVYRIVGPDGKVTFSDKPPADVTKATATNASGRPVTTSDAPLPYELRQVVARFPVALYSGANCAPCNSGRLLLQGRGIPFTEYTIGTPQDAEALQRLSGETSLPFLTIGAQKIKGFSEAEWTQFLNAAGYPATSLLSASYRSPPARPLVAIQRPPASQQVETAATEEEKSAATPPSAAPAPAPANPAGIRF